MENIWPPYFDAKEYLILSDTITACLLKTNQTIPGALIYLLTHH